MGDNPQSPDSPVLASRAARGAARDLEGLSLSGDGGVDRDDGAGTAKASPKVVVDGKADELGEAGSTLPIKAAAPVREVESPALAAGDGHAAGSEGGLERGGHAGDTAAAEAGTPVSKKSGHSSPFQRSASVTEATLRPMQRGCTDCCTDRGMEAREECDACPHCADTCGNAACPECCWKRYSVEARSQALELDGARPTVEAPAASEAGPKMKRSFSLAGAAGVGAAGGAAARPFSGKRRPGKARITMCQLRRHSTRESLWLAAHGKVYDVTPFVALHPGGERSLLRHAGQDSTVDFDFHSGGAQKLWREYQIGTIVRCPSEGGDGGRCVIS